MLTLQNHRILRVVMHIPHGVGRAYPNSFVDFARSSVHSGEICHCQKPTSSKVRSLTVQGVQAINITPGHRLIRAHIPGAFKSGHDMQFRDQDSRGNVVADRLALQGRRRLEAKSCFASDGYSGYYVCFFACCMRC